MVENVEDLLRELKYVAKQYENEKLCTFEVSRKQMAEDCIKGITFLQTECLELREEVKRLKVQIEKMNKSINDSLYENVQLEQQIEKMKCCTNCKHNNYTYWQSHCNNPKVKICKLLMQKKEVICTNYNKWESAE